MLVLRGYRLMVAWLDVSVKRLYVKGCLTRMLVLRVKQKLKR
jgi:hypothetical protein